MKIKNVILVAVINLLSLPIISQNTMHVKKVIKQDVKSLSYLVQYPASYEHSAKKKWPVMLFLHGSGERGFDLDSVRKWGPPKIADKQDLPFIIVSPQCPPERRWGEYNLELKQVLEEAINNYNIDENRIYLTGLSMGGFGVFSMAMEYPDYFAALAPVCGGGDPTRVKTIKSIPIWIFHGNEDQVVPPARSKEMVDALNEIGGNVKFTLFEGVNHFSWIPAYNDSGLFEWFLKQKKDTNEK